MEISKGIFEGFYGDKRLPTHQFRLLCIANVVLLQCKCSRYRRQMYYS